MATFIILRHPVTILVTAFTKTDKFDLSTKRENRKRHAQGPDPTSQTFCYMNAFVC